jgi:membrane protein
MRGTIERALEWAWRTFGSLIDRLTVVGFVQTGVILAAQTFLALFPLLIAATALLPADAAADVADSARARLGLGGGTTEEAMDRLVAHRSDLRGSLTVIGVVVVLASATSFTRALQRLYEMAWSLPRLGLRGSLRGLIWLVGLVVYFTLLAMALRLAGQNGPGVVLRPVLLAAGAVLLWWWTPFLLLLGRVRARALLPGALITALAMGILGKVSSVVVPRTVASNERQFGTIGAVFAIESWLVVVSCTLVAAVVTSAVLGQATGPLGRLARGTSDVDGWRRTPRMRRLRAARVSSAREPRPWGPPRSSGTE